MLNSFLEKYSEIKSLFFLGNLFMRFFYESSKQTLPKKSGWTDMRVHVKKVYYINYLNLNLNLNY